MLRPFMRLFARLTRPVHPTKPKRRRPFSGIEILEDRSVPSASISGFAYLDNNNNGIMDAGDVGVAGQTVLLNTAAGANFAATTTAADGSYLFTIPDTPVPPGSATVAATLNLSSLNSSAAATGTIAKFNPALGQLTSVEIVDNSTLNSAVRVENLAASSDTMAVAVNGSLTLQGDGIAPIPVTFTPPDDTAVVAGYAAGAPINFTGANSHDFGTQTYNNAQTVVLDGSTTDLSAFEGTGSLNLSLDGHGGTALTAGSDGILQFGTSASANVEIIYHYQPPSTFPTGNYVVEQPGDPAALYTEGQLTAGNLTPLPNSYGLNAIPFTLHDGDHLTNYNFGQVPPGGISGFVYFDANDDGVKQSNEPPVAGVQVTLTGWNDLGQWVTAAQQTGADGSYDFSELRPGGYTVFRGAVPAPYQDGKNTVGTPGNGQVVGNWIGNIILRAGASAPNNDFGLVEIASLSGFVYYDQDNLGYKAANDPPIPGTVVTLTGTTDLGVSVQTATQTAADGSYDFGNLRPGVYQITETQPQGYSQGTNTVGSLGGSVNGDQFQVQVSAGNQGTNYNFGEVLPPSPPVVPPPPPPPPVVPPPPTAATATAAAGTGVYSAQSAAAAGDQQAAVYRQ